MRTTIIWAIHYFDPLKMNERKKPRKIMIGSVGKHNLDKAYDFAFKRLRALRKCREELQNLESSYVPETFTKRVGLLLFTSLIRHK